MSPSLAAFPGGVDFPVLVDRLPHIVWIVGVDGVTEYVNQRGTEYVGPDAVAGIVADWTSVIHPDDVEALRQTWSRAAKARGAVNVECRLRRFDGTYRWHTVRADPFGDRLDPKVKWVGTATDIDDARVLQSELRAAERGAAETLALLETLQSNAPVGLGFVDRDYRRVRANAALAAFNGSTVEEQLGRRMPDVTPLVWAQLEPLYRRVLDAGETILDVEVVGPSAGDPHQNRHWLVSYYPVTVEAEIIGIGVIAIDVTQRREAERVQYLMAAIVESSGDAILATTPDWLVTTWNGAAERMFGYTAMEMTGRSAAIIAPPVLDLDGMRARLLAGGPAERHETQMRRKDESLIEVRVIVSPVADHTGATAGLSVIVEDITERIRVTRAQRAAEIRTEAGFEQGGIGAAMLDLNGIPSRVNAAACQLMGRPVESLVGRSWVEYSHPDDVPLATAVAARLAAGHDTSADERRYFRPDGSILWVAVNVTLVRDDDGDPAYFLAQMQDIGERVRIEADLAHQALHDSLTGLANRALLGDRLTNSLAATRRRGADLAVIFLDIDNIKTVNDTLGHRVGDELLKHVGGRIAGAIGAGDTLARFGGDEFVITCEDASTLATSQVAERVRAALKEPARIGDHELHTTVSMGIAFADDEATPESLLGDADAAMYVAKGLGRDRIEVFDNELRASAEGRLATASAMRHAVARNEFVVYYQPVIDLRSGQLVSAEALLRWAHPERGLVSPAEFIPLAEDSGLIIPIGAWVLEQACAQIIEWRRRVPAMSVAVNLSVRQLLEADITATISVVLARTGVPADAVCLELTESVFMQDSAYFGETLAAVKALGVTLSIDDFGTGYSSLGYLNRFPVDSVKIDRSFVSELSDDPKDSALVMAILAMADALNLSVTAEGIETEQQLKVLQDLNCPRAQGFYLSRPVPAADLTRLIAQSHRWPVP